MSKIDIARVRTGGRHTVKVTLSFEDQNGEGGATSETIRIVYRGVSLREGQEIESRFNATPDKRDAVIDALCASVLELPDILDQGQPVKPTAEFFGTLDTYYLNRINKAIVDDREGNA